MSDEIADLLDTEDLSFDLTPREKPITIGQGQYVLREVNGAGGTAYQNAVNDALIFENGKVAGYKNMEATEALLVSHCLFTVRDDNKDLHDKPVPVSTIEKWPYQLRTKLYKLAQRLSGLENAVVTKESLIKERDRLNQRIEDFEKREAEATKNS